jgi:hypothetical protein
MSQPGALCNDTVNELVVPKPSILIFNDVFYIITFVCPCAHELNQE